MSSYTVFEPHKELGRWEDGGQELRHEYVGRTRVTIDPRLGPIEFLRDGVEVPCVCDPETGVLCEFHQRQN